jgi:hypothetical protein
MIAPQDRASRRSDSGLDFFVLGRIFGWTSGATIGTLFTIAKRGELVGTDELGNRYYQRQL